MSKEASYLGTSHLSRQAPLYGRAGSGVVRDACHPAAAGSALTAGRPTRTPAATTRPGGCARPHRLVRRQPAPLRPQGSKRRRTRAAGPPGRPSGTRAVGLPRRRRSVGGTSRPGERPSCDRGSTPRWPARRGHRAARPVAGYHAPHQCAWRAGPVESACVGDRLRRRHRSGDGLHPPDRDSATRSSPPAPLRKGPTPPGAHHDLHERDGASSLGRTGQPGGTDRSGSPTTRPPPGSTPKLGSSSGARASRRRTSARPT